MHPLKRIRLERSLSEWEVGFLADVPQTYIFYDERGYPALKLRHKKKVAEFFHVKVVELFPEERNGGASR